MQVLVQVEPNTHNEGSKIVLVTNFLELLHVCLLDLLSAEQTDHLVLHGWEGLVEGLGPRVVVEGNISVSLTAALTLVL